VKSYYEGLRRCKTCGKRFYSDCADICQECFKVEVYKEARAEAVDRISKFRLTIELVPETSWYSNLRNRVGRDIWNKIRYQSYRDAGYKCSVCGRGKVSLSCHEVWEYDDDKHIQKLKGFVALCELCHRVKHIGLAGIQLSKVEYNAVIRHFRRVNGCSYDDFKLARDMAFEVWEDRSMFDWTIELGEFEGLLAGGSGESFKVK